jgi:hypothetical protein
MVTGGRADRPRSLRPNGVERADAMNIRIPIEEADIGLRPEGA